MSKMKLVNGVMIPDETPEKPPKAPPKGKQFTEVRLRQFYTNEAGMVVMPTVVYYFEDGKTEPDMEVGQLSAKLAKDINETLPFEIRCMDAEEIAEELAKELSVGSVVASQGKAALGVFAKNLKDEKPKAAEPPKAANDNEPPKAA